MWRSSRWTCFFNSSQGHALACTTFSVVGHVRPPCRHSENRNKQTKKIFSKVHKGVFFSCCYLVRDPTIFCPISVLTDVGCWYIIWHLLMVVSDGCLVCHNSGWIFNVMSQLWGLCVYGRIERWHYEGVENGVLLFLLTSNDCFCFPASNIKNVR